MEVNGEGIWCSMGHFKSTKGSSEVQVSSERQCRSSVGAAPEIDS